MANQLSHEALTIYLRNLRTLEYIKRECEESIRKINSKSNQLQYELNKKAKQQPKLYNATEPRPPYNTFKTLSTCFILTGIITVILLCVLWGTDDFWFLCLCCMPAIFIGVIFRIISVKVHKNNKTAYENQLSQYQAIVRYNQSIIANHNYEVAQFENKVNQFNSEAQRRINAINAYIRHIDNMLQKAYSLNIVPIQFRGIYGVTYLYDFISTSHLSLSDAVLNYNMEQIKYKLDNIISRCNDIIYEQQRTNANLSTIRRQNNQLLAEARNISHNTALASQYSEIAAENSAISLELQKKQLIYQEVDFWLNSV